MISEDLTTNADCSASTGVQTEHDKSNNTTSPIIWDASVQRI